jgi:hypothetical protein
MKCRNFRKRVNGFVLSSRFFALRAVVGSSGPETGVQSSRGSVASLPLPASGPEDYSPEGDLVNRATLTNLVSTHATVRFRDAAGD